MISDILIGTSVKRPMLLWGVGERALLEWLTLFLLVAWFVFPLDAFAFGEVEVEVPKYMAKPYTERQTFKGQAYYKDNNIWIYTPKFAEVFGMPNKGVSKKIKGIEAAAFRVETRSYQQCGLGRKDENCRPVEQCIVDVYIDEKAHPLPWATDSQADWHPNYSSVQWLAYPGGGYGLQPFKRSDWKYYTNLMSLYPFKDLQTNDWIVLVGDGNAPKNRKGVVDFMPIFGYKRNAIAGLTMITFAYGCMSRNLDKPERTFSFRSISEGGYQPWIAKKIYQWFSWPVAFERQIDAVVKSKHERDREFMLNILNGKK